MPPKVGKKSTAKTAVYEEPLPPGYSPSTHQKFLKCKDWFTVTGESEIIAVSMVDVALEGLINHIQAKKLIGMVIPYTIEDSMAVSLEPSLLYNFTQDNKLFYCDTEQERQEPQNQTLDWHCGDRAKGPEKLQKRILPNPDLEKNLSRSGSSKKSSRRSNFSPNRLSGSPTRLISNTFKMSTTGLNFKIKDMNDSKIKISGQNNSKLTNYGDKSPSFKKFSELVGSVDINQKSMSADSNRVETFASEFKPIYKIQDPAIVHADEILRHKMMVRNKIEGRYHEEGGKSKKQQQKMYQSDSKKNALVQPKQGSAQVIGPLGMEVVTELQGEHKFRIFQKSTAEKELQPKYEIQRESALSKKQKKEPQIHIVTSDISETCLDPPDNSKVIMNRQDTKKKLNDMKSMTADSPSPIAHHDSNSTLKKILQPQQVLTTLETKIEKIPDEIVEENIEPTVDENYDPFSEAYLNSLNESIHSLSPDKIRERSTEILEPKSINNGTNANVFSSNTDVVDQILPKNGVKLKNQKIEIGPGKYINENKSKMSLQEYNTIAKENMTSLANIALRGLTEIATTPQIAFQPETSSRDPFVKKKITKKLNSRSGLNSNSWLTEHSKYIDDDMNSRILQKSVSNSKKHMQSNDKIIMSNGNSQSMDFKMLLVRDSNLRREMFSAQEKDDGNILLNDQTEPSQLQIRKSKRIESPVHKYKMQSSFEKRYPFKLKDIVSNSPPKQNFSRSILSSSNMVLDRLRVSQQLVEQREMKLKKNVLPQILKADDGDHGMPSGYIKRKGYPSPALQSLAIMPDVNTLSRGNLLNLESRKYWPQTTKNKVNQSVDLGAPQGFEEFSVKKPNYKKGLAEESLADISYVEISKEDLHPNPASGFKKIQLPNLRDRNRQLLSERISIQNVNVNKSYRRYAN